MDDIIKFLLDFSEQNDLWTLARKTALETLDNYFIESKAETLFEFSGLTSKNFILENHTQELVFWKFDAPTFIVRTTLILYRDNSPTQLNIGEYSLDVDSSGTIVDDWLIFR